jgi:hypothetical protein
MAPTMLESVRRPLQRPFAAYMRNTCAAMACILATGIGGYGCQKSDEEILKERIDTTSVHLYLASKIAITKSDQPEAKKVREDLNTIMASLEGSKSTPTGTQITPKDVLVLLGSLYSFQGEGKELLRSGNEKGMKPILPFLFDPNPELNKVLDLNLEHAFLLSGLFVAKFHPDLKVPVPDEIALYEAWMTNSDAIQLEGFIPLVRGMKAVLYGNNELCDLAGKEGQGAERDAGKLTGESLRLAFTAVNGKPSTATDEQAKHTSIAIRAFVHGAAALCYKKRDKGDDAKKFIDELDGFLKAADDMGIRSSETVFIRAYVAIRRDDREGAKKVLEAVRDDPKTDAATKKDIEKLIAHLNDDGFISSYFDRVYFIKTTTVIVLRRLDEVGAFDPIKESDLVKTVNAYIGATGQALGHAKESISKDAVRDKLKSLTEGK